MQQSGLLDQSATKESELVLKMTIKELDHSWKLEQVSAEFPGQDQIVTLKHKFR